MTEEEWLTGDSSGRLLEHFRKSGHLSPKARGRKYRIAALAMVRELVGADEVPELTPVLDAVEGLCDGRYSLADVSAVFGRADLPVRSDIHPNWGWVARCLVETDSFSCLRAIAGATQLGKELPAVGTGIRRPAFIAVQCRILRDVLGNPFRPAAFSPDWRTDTAVSLARQMYELRDFSAMPILADALQDAGCDSDEVLDHCRGSIRTPAKRRQNEPALPHVHVRGCWVVDLVLGKA